MAVRPFRSPHHSVSDAGLVGGGSTPQPGEISLAHKGVLFLDELPEFNRKTLEVLRQPLEEGEVTISRALRSTTFPAEFILVAAMNPCPCGYRSDPRRACSCTPPQVEKYLSKISGPLLDRIDLHVEVPAVPFTQLAEAPPGPTSADFLRARCSRPGPARPSGSARKGPRVNGRMTPRQVRKFCPLKPEAHGDPQGGDGRAGPLGPGPRQGPAGRADDGRPRRSATTSSRSTSPRPSATARSTAASGRDRAFRYGDVTMSARKRPNEAIQTLDDLLERLGGISPRRVRFHPAPGTATEADVIEVEKRENRHCELVDGVLVEKAMGYRNRSWLA